MTQQHTPYDEDVSRLVALPWTRGHSDALSMRQGQQHAYLRALSDMQPKLEEMEAALRQAKTNCSIDNHAGTDDPYCEACRQYDRALAKADGGDAMNCPDCEGTGSKLLVHPESGAFMVTGEHCESCGGTGELRCQECLGPADERVEAGMKCGRCAYSAEPEEA